MLLNLQSWQIHSIQVARLSLGILIQHAIRFEEPHHEGDIDKPASGSEG